VDQLLNVQMTPSRPVYDMASDTPLVLWDCIFPDLEQVDSRGHGDSHVSGYSDALDWIYAGDLGDANELSSRRSIGTEDRKYGSLSIMENLWLAWRKAKIDEVLAGSLMDVFARQGNQADSSRGPDRVKNGDEAVRVFDGSESPRSVGTYVPIMERKRLEPPDVINARFATRKGWTAANADDADMDE
jgi:tRNA pseudouridine38/39 synthase